jgi:iron uptake system component EfeO
MDRLPIRSVLIVAIAGFLVLFASACGSEDDASGDARPIEASTVLYRSYLKENAAALVSMTRSLANLIEAGELTEAQTRYASARYPYGRIEQVAESFGDLDLRVDAVAGEVPAKKFGGFHRIEKALFDERTTEGMGPVARQLLADVEELQRKVATVDLKPAQIAERTRDLLRELTATMLADEEQEPYADLDLVDIAASIGAAASAFEAVKPPLVEKDPELAREIEAALDELYAWMEFIEYGNGEPAVKFSPSYIQYHNVTPVGVRRLAERIDAVAEPLGQVPAQIAEP